MRSLALALALAAALQAPPRGEPQGKAGAPPAGPAPALDDKTYKHWLDFIRPSADELKWKAVPWRADFAAAIQEAKALERPILLWSDQGNPLGMVDMAPSVNTVVARRQVWSDDEVQKLAANFLPATAEVWTLATGRGPGPDFFHKAGGPTAGAMAHGLYCFTPDGEGLGFHFLSRPKEPVVKLLTEALKKWNDLVVRNGYKPKPVPALKSKETWPERSSKAGLFLVVHARDLPRGNVARPGRDDAERMWWNLSFLEFSEKEAEGFVPAGGSTATLPEAIFKKLVRRHLGDFSHGNNGGFDVERALKKGSLTSEVISATESFVTLRLRGDVTLEEGTRGYDPKAHGQQLAITGDHRIDQEGLYGFQGTFHGRAVFDTRRKKFVQFELVAAGTRKGLRPKDDYQPAPMGFAFTIEGQPEKPAPGDKTPGGR